MIVTVLAETNCCCTLQDRVNLVGRDLFYRVPRQKYDRNMGVDLSINFLTDSSVAISCRVNYEFFFYTIVTERFA